MESEVKKNSCSTAAAFENYECQCKTFLLNTKWGWEMNEKIILDLQGIIFIYKTQSLPQYITVALFLSE